MREQAVVFDAKFHAFSLDGQDRDAGADYLLTDAHRFAIVEFKYSENNLVSEKHKSKRLSLCKKLESRKDMIAYHDKCHFIAWSELDTGAIKSNVYRHEICNEKVFGPNCKLSKKTPFISQRVSASKFSSDFFGNGGTRSLSLTEFETYLAWLMKDASSSTNSTLELMARNTASNDLALVRLKSILEAQNWVKRHISKPKRHRGNEFGI